MCSVYLCGLRGPYAVTQLTTALTRAHGGARTPEQARDLGSAVASSVDCGSACHLRLLLGRLEDDPIQPDPISIIVDLHIEVPPAGDVQGRGGSVDASLDGLVDDGLEHSDVKDG